jgi:hypothetical protein
MRLNGNNFQRGQAYGTLEKAPAVACPATNPGKLSVSWPVQIVDRQTQSGQQPGHLVDVNRDWIASRARNAGTRSAGIFTLAILLKRAIAMIFAHSMRIVTERALTRVHFDTHHAKDRISGRWGMGSNEPA